MKQFIFISTLLFFIFINPLQGQNDSIDVSELVIVNREGLFDSDEILKMELRFDIRQFTRKKFTDEYHDALMTYYPGDKDTVTRQIKLRSRGEFRRSYCDFPPIRLNLKKGELQDDIFSGFDKIKMVTHCKLGSRDYILKEYLVYKLFNVMTDISFRVRLLEIDYIDTSRPRKPLIEFAFLIEPVEMLAERTNSFHVNSLNLIQKQMRADMMIRVAVFNYMIGNYDWSVPRAHNMVFLSQPLSEEANRALPVPYDFDYSGFVNTSYAIPPNTLPIKTVRERLYLGVCQSEEEFKIIIDEFLEKKEDFIKIIEEFPHLKERSKKDVIKYLNSFYLDFNKRNTILYKLLSQCID